MIAETHGHQTEYGASAKDTHFVTDVGLGGL